jgi:hypothetical protein
MASVEFTQRVFSCLSPMPDMPLTISDLGQPTCSVLYNQYFENSVTHGKLGGFRNLLYQRTVDTAVDEMNAKVFATQTFPFSPALKSALRHSPNSADRRECVVVLL